MAALNFPDPNVTTTYTNPDTGITYEWSNNTWKAIRSAQTAPELFVDYDGDNMTGDLTFNTDKIVLGATFGTGTFAGDLSTGTFSPGSTTTTGTSVLASGQINVQQASGSNGYFTRGFQGNAETYYVKSDGSASFASGNINIATNGFVSSERLFAGDPSTTVLEINSSVGKSYLRGYATGHGSDAFSISREGSATFAGDVAVDTGMIVGANAQPRITINKAYGITVRPISLDDGGAATDLLWTGYSNDNSTVTSEIAANGSATFAGAVEVDEKVIASRASGSDGAFIARVQGSTDNNAVIYSNGNATFGNRAATGDWSINPTNGIRYNSGSAEEIILDTSGSATFAGDVTASGYLRTTNFINCDRYSPNRIFLGDGLDGKQYGYYSTKADGTLAAGLGLDGSAYFTSNVGIGQEDPQGDLHIGNISGNKDLIMHSANNGNARLRFREGGSNTSGFNEYSFGMVGNQNAMTWEKQGLGEVMRIDSSGNVGLGTNNPQNKLVVSDGGNDGIEFNPIGENSDPAIYSYSRSGDGYRSLTTLALDHRFKAGSSPQDAMMIDSSGRLLVGSNSSTGTSTLQVQGLTGIDARGAIQLQYNGSPSGSTTMSEVRFTDSSGNQGATISAASESTWDTNDYPTRLVFSTTADGDSNPTERMRIRSNGIIRHSVYDEWMRSDGTTHAGFVGRGDMVIANGNDADFGVATGGGDLVFGSGGNAERMRIDSSGRLLVGPTSTATPSSVVIQGNSVGSTSYGLLRLTKGTTSPADGDALGLLAFGDSNHNTAAQIICKRDGGTWTSGSSHPTRIEFYTASNGSSGSTERMRIDSSGQLILMGASAVENNALDLSYNSSSGQAQINADSDGGSTFITFGTSSSGSLSERMRLTNHGRLDVFTSSSADVSILSSAGSAGTVLELISGRHSASSIGTGTKSFVVYTNGNVQNTNEVYGQISDVKLKENIVDAPSQWEDFKAVRFRKYNFKEETGHETHTQLGVIAQELETVCPGLVYETVDRDQEGNDLGTTTKAVKSSILTKKALVALQEAMERIETLETQNADLLARVASLEG